MGNSLDGGFAATELGVGSLHKEDEDAARYIAKAFVSTKDGITKIKNKGHKWVAADDDDEALLWKTKSVGKIRSHTVVEDSTGKQVATIITEKKGMASITNYVCRSVPSFEGQSPLTEEELKKAGITNKDKDDKEFLLYQFSRIKTSRKWTTAKCTYDIVAGEDDFRTLYVGEKLSSLGFRAIFKEIAANADGKEDDSGIVVAKAFMPGVSMSPHVDAAIGVDLLAIVSMGYALAGDESAAGALAGAGVV